MRLAAPRACGERNPPGRRSWVVTSAGSIPRASSFLTMEAPAHGVEQRGDLLVAEAVGAPVGDEAGRGAGDLIEYNEVVLAQGVTRGGEGHHALGEAHERGELDPAVELGDLRLPAKKPEKAAGGGL